MSATTTDRLSIKLCRSNPDKIFVFGDNLIGRGKRGQAIIRDAPNAFGIPTKRLPSMREGAFFRDRKDEELALFASLSKLKKLKANGWEIVFPSSGLGTGLAKMKEKSPRLFSLMNQFICDEFGVDFNSLNGDG